MDYIVGSLVGAVIGYITNWLAIKMLFRPYKEVRIGKMKMPFTPGLIPKERDRIAKSVGETIGKHLLTKETIIQSLCSENMNEQLDLWVQNKISSMENSDATVGDEIRALMGDEYTNFIEHANARVSEFLAGYINNENVKQSVLKFAKEQVMKGLRAKPQDVLQSGLYDLIKDKLLKEAVEYKDSEKFYNEIEKMLVEKISDLKSFDKSFREIIPGTIINSAKDYIYSKKYDIAIGIKELLKDEKSRRKLRQIVGETIGSNLNPMIAMFINADKIYEKVQMGIHEYLDDEKNHDDIALLINGIVDELLKNPVSRTVSEMPEEGIAAGIKSVVDLLREKVFDEKFIKDILYKVEAKLNSYTSVEEMLRDTGIDYEGAILGFLDRHIESFASSNSFNTKFAETVAIMIDRLLSLRVNSIFKETEGKIAPSVSKIARDLYNKFIENNASDVIEILNIPKIVEDKINEFDVDYAEQIILEVADKELKAITWLGALLGAVMGVLSPIISSF